MASTIKVDKIAQASGTPEFTIPTADGTAGQFLKTDGSGVLAFDTVTTNPLSLTGSTNTWIPTITGADALTGTANFTYDGNILDVKNSGTASSIKLYCESSNAHYQAIKAAPHAGSSDWTLTLPGVVPTVSGQSLTATTAGVASWTTVGGLTEASIWRLTTDFTDNATPIASNWEAADTYGAGTLGSAMTESSGLFTFPSTGIWEVTFYTDCSGNSTNYAYNYSEIRTTTDNSTYNIVAVGYSNMDNGANNGSPVTAHSSACTIFDVTSTTNCKVRFDVRGSATQYIKWHGDTNTNETYAVFMKLGDT